MEPDDIRRLSMPDAQAFIREHSNDDPRELVLTWEGRINLPIKAVAEQIRCLSKAKTKLPEIADTGFLFEETALSQSSGQAAAKFKSSLLKGKHLIDCTGGLGIDTTYLHKNFEHVLYCERSEFKRELFRSNRELLNADNVEISNEECVEALLNHEDAFFDWAYIDPSRRDSSRRYIGLEQCEPNVYGLEELLVKKAKQVCIKASPALEIKDALKNLKTIYKAAVISVNGECKEVLLFLSQHHKHQRLTFEAILLDGDGHIRFSIQRSLNQPKRQKSAVSEYLYEPDPALIKADVLNEVAHELSLSFIHPYSAYMTSDFCISDYPGRVFRVNTVNDWSRKSFKRYIRDRDIKKAHVARRWFPMKVELIKSRFGILDGGDDYFFFTEDLSGKQIVIHGSKLD